MVAIVVAVGLLAMAPAAYAATYVVGGTTQKWNYAQNGYSYDTNWAPLQTYVVGDVLQFQYTPNQHDVVEYATKAEYDACGGTPVQTWTSGNDLVTLNSTGTKYYICSLPGHCQEGMKVSVTVGTAAATPPAVAPATPPTTTPSPPATTTPPPPGPGGNAASSGPVLSMALLLAAAMVAGLAFLV
jgi:hypothetical protein